MVMEKFRRNAKLPDCVETFNDPMFDLPSGNHTKSYLKLPFIVDLTIKNGDFP
jgi:hypothetical protein